MNILYVGEFLFFCGNLALADYHASQFNKDKTISHTLWFCIMVFIVALFTWVSRWNWYFCGSLVLERIWAFNPLLNYFRKPRKPFFYTHSGKGGSWIDSKIGNSYPYIFVGSLIGFVILQFYI